MTISFDAIRELITTAEVLEPQPVATAEQVAAFEARLGASLPEDYRAFLLSVGDGVWVDGEPCLYGIEAVLADLGKGNAARAFPYDDADAAALRRAMAAITPGSTLMESAAFMALQKKAPWGEGAITIASNGGNDFSTLVLVGPQRGVMWRAGELDHPETLDLYGTPGDLTTPLSFAVWLPLWLEATFGVRA